MTSDSPWLEQEQLGAGSEQKTAPREGVSAAAAAGLGQQQGWPGWPRWPGKGALALLVVAALRTWQEPCPARGGAGLCEGAPAHPQRLMACSGNDWQVWDILRQNCSWWLRLGVSESSAGRRCFCALAS